MAACKHTRSDRQTQRGYLLRIAKRTNFMLLHGARSVLRNMAAESCGCAHMRADAAN